MIFYEINNKIVTFLFPSRKSIVYCMKKRELSGSLKYILVMLLFQFCLHIFCLFLGLAI
uniref:Macaca fascicularis brain cDNA clone: QflA-20553, similar to human serine (or cysteine) proteinase inhibitor, clade A(alpha-1 antiproteinase, antitrypsin), member 10(SERPINA10), mRNA, RefSeq: NM_01... n=1 Tax=Macaca fascicularis TaxID=9541 RepID=I7GCW4_MACFA|nr:unnamed protein product [Macaca fascicularis]